MVEAARETGFPLVVLHGVVPFIDVTEHVHPLLLSEPSGEAVPLRSAADDLLTGLAAGTLSSSEITSAAYAAGLALSPADRALALVVRLTTHTPGATGVSAVREVVRQRLGQALVAPVGRSLLVVASVRSAVYGSLRSSLHDLVDALDAELAATVGGHVLHVTSAGAVDDLAGLARAVPVTLEAADLGDSLGLGSRVLLTHDLGVYHVLSSVVGDAELERFVAEQLGPLLDRDAHTGSDLVQTLDAYLEAGLSKTAAAAALGVRRQTLYSRLDQISRCLGGLDLTDRRRRTALDLALVAWRLRTSAAARSRRSAESPLRPKAGNAW
jgi:purine catabolism regulator